jgi:hypothetical protein
LYQVVTEPTAWIDVEWAGLDDEGFEIQPTIRMKVVFLPLSDMQRVLSGEAQEDTIDFAKRVSRDWSQIVGPDKKPWPFTPENLETMVDLTPGFALGFQTSYQRAWLGQGKVREKNSPGSLADGRAGEEAGTKPQA